MPFSFHKCSYSQIFTGAVYQTVAFHIVYQRRFPLSFPYMLLIGTTICFTKWAGVINNLFIALNMVTNLLCISFPTKSKCYESSRSQSGLIRFSPTHQSATLSTLNAKSMDLQMSQGRFLLNVIHLVHIA